MNEYALALDFLSKQEGGGEHKEAIAAYTKALLDESKDRASKLREANAKLKRLGEAAGGTEEDLEKTISDLRKQLTETTTERDSLKSSSEKSAKELETLKAEKESRDKEARMRSLSEKAGADYEAFNQLFSNMSVDLIGETITIKENDGDKSLSLDEYLEGQPAWKRAALFVGSQSSSSQDKQTNKLPSAPTSGGQGNSQSVGDKYISGRYSVSRFAKK